LLQNKPCVVTVIIFVVIPLLTGNVLFDVQGVQAERAANLLTVFHTNPVNPQATTTNPATATTTGVHLPFGYGTANQAANPNYKGASSTPTTTNFYQANQANIANTNAVVQRQQHTAQLRS
jgi:hypothetical protein